MPKPLDIAWIEVEVLAGMQREATKKAPLETGGCLMGYWVKEFTEVVITEIIGPGKKAKHRSWYFSPDSKWQTKQIEEIYLNSGRLITYLGDWHSHPKDNNSLSFIDRWTIMRIGQHKPARVRAPLMGIIYNPPEWPLILYCKKSILKPHWLLKSKIVSFYVKPYINKF